jgi:hypothetical protein
MPCTAEKASLPPEASNDPCAEYFGCLHYGTLTEAQARTARGHPLFVEAQEAMAPRVLQSSAAPDRALASSPIASSQHQ